MRAGGCPAVVAQWQSTGGSSQGCPGFDSRRLLGFSLSSIFASEHLNSFIIIILVCVCFVSLSVTVASFPGLVSCDQISVALLPSPTPLCVSCSTEMYSLVPRPLPDFNYLAAVTKLFFTAVRKNLGV